MAATLVPGDPHALRAWAADLTHYGNGLAAAGDELRKVDAGGSWAGDAADAFRARYDGFTPQWFTAADAFHGAAGAVGRYADVLEWAQGRAAEAERLEAQARGLSRAAVTEYDADAARGVARPPFVDPGAAIEAQARTTLDDAVAQLRRAGNDAARAVAAAAATAPAEPFWTRVGEGLSDAGAEIGAVAEAFGRSMIDHPEAVTAAALGTGAIILGAAGDVGGGALTATVAGAPVGIPAVAASTGLIVGGVAAVGGSAMTMAKGAKDNFQRPSRHRKGVRDTTFEQNRGDDGKVRDPATKEEIEKESKWDMGHKPGKEFRRHQEDARRRGISRKEFLDEHNNPDNYRPETQNTNRSHRLEDKSDRPGGK